MLSQQTIDRIKHIYEKWLSSCNSWEQEFISEMYDRVTDAESQEAPIDEYFISRRQAEKIDEIWEDLGL